MPVAFNEHAHQPSKAWKGEGEGRGWGGGDNQAKLGITKLSEQRHNPTTLQNSRIRISRSSCIRIEHFQGFGCERSCKCTHLPTPRKIKAASAICWHSNPRTASAAFCDISAHSISPTNVGQTEAEKYC